MTTPTPGSDPNHPQGGTPSDQPGWGAPQPQGYRPAPSYTGGPAGYGAPTGQRPGMVTAAAVIGIVLGALGVLGIFSIGAYFAFDAVLGILNLLAVAAAVVLLVGGIQAIQGKSPRLLLLGSYASIAVQLLTLIWAALSGWGFVFLGLIGFVLPGLIAFFLRQAQSKQYYTARGIRY
jgi:hypothetical protein